jgi:hypothetical protein
MKYIIFCLLLISCQKTEKEYCWVCENITIITFERQEPVTHKSISEYCQRTESWIKQSEKDGTFKNMIITGQDTVKYNSNRKCKIK